MKKRNVFEQRFGKDWIKTLIIWFVLISLLMATLNWFGLLPDGPKPLD